jgi:hypothetical protein
VVPNDKKREEFMARDWRKVSAEEAKAHPLYGLKNWLVVFALGVLLVPLKEFGALKGEAHQLGMTVGQLLDADASFKTYVTLVLATEVAMVATIFGLMVSKSAHFRIATSVIWVAFFPLITLFAFLTGTPGIGALVLSFFPWVISCLVWVTYLQRSKRVRVTFEHRVLALDVGATQAASSMPEAANMPAGGAQRISANSALSPASVSPIRHSSTKLVDASSTLLVADERATTNPKVEDEEDLWAQALDEFNGAGRKQGVWAKAFAQASGNEPAAQAQYLRERFGQLSEERAKDLIQAVEHCQKLKEAELDEIEKQKQEMPLHISKLDEIEKQEHEARRIAIVANAGFLAKQIDKHIQKSS